MCYVLSVLEPDFRLGSRTAPSNSYVEATKHCGRLGSVSDIWERERWWTFFGTGPGLRWMWD